MRPALRRVLGVAALFLIWTPTAEAQSPPPLVLPTATPALPALPLASPRALSIGAARPVDFRWVEFYLGTWTCRRTVPPPSAANPTTVSHVHVDRSYGNAWLVMTIVQPRSDAERYDYVTHNYVTYDRSIRKWVMTSFDSVGGYDLAFGRMLAPGKIEWTEAHDAAARQKPWSIVHMVRGAGSFATKYTGPDTRGHVQTTRGVCTKDE